MAKRRVFLTYHHADQAEVDAFVSAFKSGFDDMCAVGVTDADDFIKSANTDYVLRRIREKYITGTSATIALIGRCTWARRYVDWELAATLRDNPNDPRGGLVAVQLNSVDGQDVPLPERIRMNVKRDPHGNDLGYAAYYRHPGSVANLTSWVEDAIWRRDNRSPASGSTADLKMNDSAC